MKKKLRILIAGGGTGGHLFPGISIAEALQQRRDCDIRFVGTTHGIEMKSIPPLGYPLYTLPVSGLYRVGALKKIKSLFKLPFAVLKALSILISFRPHLVVGVGGYASGPMLALSVALFRHTILQEQNAYPGLTNRLLGKYVPLSFVPFTGMDHLFRNSVVVGNPIRQAITEVAGKKINRDGKKIVLTIIGGSQGARILNRAIVNLLPLLVEKADQIRIVHQTGKWDHDWVMEAYQANPQLEARVQPFFDDITEVYQQSHLLLCRAGSMVNEIIAIGRASILVPIAVSSGNHQLENGRKMAQANASILIEEKDFSPDILADKLFTLMESPQTIQAMEQNAHALYGGDSAAKIADATLKFYNL